MRQVFIFFCCFFYLCIAMQAQNAWSLDSCIEYALQHNLTIKNLHHEQASGNEQYRQSIRELLPTISANTNYFIQYGRSIDPNNNAIVRTDFFSNNYSLSGSLTIFQGFQRLNTIKARKFILKALDQEVLQEKYLLAFRVMQAYYDVLFFTELIQISTTQQEISQNNYNLVKRQIELGIKAGADLYEAESLLVSDQLTVTQNQNSLKQAQLRLTQEMNWTTNSAITIFPENVDILEDIASENTDADDIYQKALAFIPTIIAGEYRVESAKKEVAISRGTLLPSLTFSGGYSTGFFETNVDASGDVISFSDQISDNASQFVGASLNIPVFQRWSGRSQIKQQKIAHLQATNNLDIRKQELQNIISELVQNYEASMAEYDQTKQRTLSRKLTFEIAQKRYDKGLINALELFTAKNLYATAQNENLQIKLKLQLQRKTINFYQGLPVFTINNSAQ